MRSDPRKRYSTTEPFSFDDGSKVVFRGLRPRTVSTKAAYIEHEIQVGDRLDSLAEEYYGDPRLWWVIAQANPAIFFSADLVYGAVDVTEEEKLPVPKAGTTLYIPAKSEGPV